MQAPREMAPRDAVPAEAAAIMKQRAEQMHQIIQQQHRQRPGLVEGLPHPHTFVVPGAVMPNPAVGMLPSDPGLLKASNSAVSQSPRFQPYRIPHHFQFTLTDLDRCLYGKQEIRAVQIQEGKGPPTSGAAAAAASIVAQAALKQHPEDKKQPAKWCDMCEEVRFGVCPQHGPLPSMRPSTSLSGPKSYAISTFPDEVGLCISSIPMAGYGVFARHFIPMGTWIGPYEGRKLSLEDGFKIIGQGDASFLWEIYENYRLSHFLDASDENASSWMRFIQCARHRGEQNLFVFQYYGSIYYRAFKDIQVGAELLVWYDDKYPQYFGIPYGIRDMSSYSVESIQAPLEMAGKGGSETETRSSIESRVDPSSKAALVASQSLMGSIERSEPPRIPQPGRLHPHGPSSSSSASFQPPPAQPPQLTQAPGISAVDAARLGAVIPSSLQRPPHHIAFMHGHSQRAPIALRGENPHTSHMMRSLSAEDLRKRRSPNSAALHDRSSADRHLERGVHHLERRGHPSDRHPSERHTVEQFVVNQPLAGHLPPQINMQTPPGSTAQFLAVPGFARAPVMSAGQHTVEELKARGEDPTIFKPPDRDPRGPQELHRLPGPPGHDWTTFKCRQCGQSFNQKNAYERHNCVPEASKPFQCGRCQLSFPDAQTLQGHMLIHTSDRPFKCGFCSRSFSGADSLNSHMRVHMSENDPVKKEERNTPVICPKCGRRFLNLMDLNKHFSPNGECLP